MADEWYTYINDTRTVCKYGEKCYQKNPEHHKRFKHPMQNKKRKHVDEKSKDKEIKQFKLISDDTEEEDLIEPKEPLTLDNVAPKFFPASLPPITNQVLPINFPDDLQFYDENVDCSSKMKELFLVNMPPDFYKFYECIKKEKDFVVMLLHTNLQLVGPFDLLLGRLPIIEEKEFYLIHGRFYYDPPEFQTVLKKKGTSEYHIGYYRDNPDDMPVFLGSNDSSKDCQITPMATNIFGAVYLYLENELKVTSDPMACRILKQKVKTWSEEHNYFLEPYPMKKRLQNIVTRTLHGAGIVVPYNKKTEVGYRRLAKKNAVLKTIFDKIEKAEVQTEKDGALCQLQPVITFANIAMDESDFGTGLELGLDLFLSGLKELSQSALSLLRTAYTLLNREAFIEIAQTHIQHRRKGPRMSLI